MGKMTGEIGRRDVRVESGATVGTDRQDLSCYTIQNGGECSIDAAVAQHGGWLRADLL